MKETNNEVIISSSGTEVEFDPDSMLPNEIFDENIKTVFPLEDLGIVARVSLSSKNILTPLSTNGVNGTLLYYSFTKSKEKPEQEVNYSFVILCDKKSTRKILVNQDIIAICLNDPNEDIGNEYILLKDKITKIETLSIRQNGYVLKIEA